LPSRGPPAIKDIVAASPVPLVFDHFGGAQAALGVEQPGFADLVELVKSGKAYVKISGAYRASKLAPDYADCVPFAQALIAANADRRKCRSHRLGHRLAASGFGDAARQAADRGDAAVPDRRWTAAQPASGMGTGRSGPQKDFGRQSGKTLRILNAGT
jgi:hypothetical protein